MPSVEERPSWWLQRNDPNRPPTPDLASKPLAGLHVALDVGHSKASVGALSSQGRGEYYYNLDTVETFTEVLREAGAKVTVINEKGLIRGLSERPESAAKAGADVFISVHHDSVNEKYKERWTYEGKTELYSDQFKGYSVFCSEANPAGSRGRCP